MRYHNVALSIRVSISLSFACVSYHWLPVFAGFLRVIVPRVLGLSAAGGPVRSFVPPFTRAFQPNPAQSSLVQFSRSFFLGGNGEREKVL